MHAMDIITLSNKLYWREGCGRCCMVYKTYIHVYRWGGGKSSIKHI